MQTVLEQDANLPSALLRDGYQVFNRFLQAWNSLQGKQLHAGRALELRQFLLEREQALAAGGELGSALAHWGCRAAPERDWLIGRCRSASSTGSGLAGEYLWFSAARLYGLSGTSGLEASNLWSAPLQATNLAGKRLARFVRHPRCR